MNHDNPTPLRLGMTGSFVGRRYRVDGRIVLSMDLAGETWFWNEFALVATDGETATLVHEEGEEGPEWRLFRLIEPATPITAAEAARVRVGDTVDLTGVPVRVSLVDESRVEFIEGQAPEGVEVGDVARYFNAENETGSEMLVASWTGDEIEFYRGMNLPVAAVAAAFRLPSLADGAPPAPRSSPAGAGFAAGQWIRPILALVVMGSMGLAFLRGCERPRRDPAVARVRAPEAPLKPGSTGVLEGRQLRVAGHALVEIAQVHRFYDRHEYLLKDDQDRTLLLVCGWEPNSRDWYLCTPLPEDQVPSPREAGALRWGDRITLGGSSAAITEIFRCTTRETDARPPELPFGTLTYGFAAVSGNQTFLARWDATAARYHRGIAVPAKTARAAFAR
jgi:hypothetical protein